MSPVRHSFVSAKTDPADTTLVRPSDWNADHEEGVKAFGAVGDGVTNDTAAIQAAIDSVYGDGGGLVYVPDGSYLVGSLTTYPTVQIRGNGYNTLLTLASATNANMFTRGGTHGQFLVLENMRLNGNSAGNSSGAAIVLSNTYVGARLQNLIIESFAGSGVSLTNCDQTLINDVAVNNCGDDGFVLDHCTQMTLVHCSSERSGNVAMRLTATDHTALINPQIEQTTGSAKVGILLDSCLGTSIYTAFCYATGTQTAAIQITNDHAVRSGYYTISSLVNSGFTTSIDNQVTGVDVTGNVSLYADSMSPYALTVENNFIHNGSNLAFRGASPIGKEAVSGSRAGNAALADLLTKLANLGLITDSTSA